VMWKPLFIVTNIANRPGSERQKLNSFLSDYANGAGFRLFDLTVLMQD
jgi:hypothetical protein